MKRAAIIIALVILELGLGAIFVHHTWHIPVGNSIYCSIGIASTDGCNTAPTGTAGEIVAMFLMLTTIPALATVFSLISNFHLKKHINQKLSDHHDAIKEMINNGVQRPPEPGSVQL